MASILPLNPQSVHDRQHQLHDVLGEQIKTWCERYLEIRNDTNRSYKDVQGAISRATRDGKWKKSGCAIQQQIIYSLNGRLALEMPDGEIVELPFEQNWIAQCEAIAAVFGAKFGVLWEESETVQSVEEDWPGQLAKFKRGEATPNEVAALQSNGLIDGDDLTESGSRCVLAAEFRQRCRSEQFGAIDLSPAAAQRDRYPPPRLPCRHPRRRDR